MAQTLKEAMAERGLTAANLGAFFGVTETHAAQWMNHQKKVHRTKLVKLRDAFLNMGIDTFEPIRKELTSVEIDKKKIVLPESIKSFGAYEVAVKLHPQVTGKLTVKVTEA